MKVNAATHVDVSLLAFMPPSTGILLVFLNSDSGKMNKISCSFTDFKMLFSALQTISCILPGLNFSLPKKLLILFENSQSLKVFTLDTKNISG